MGVSLNISLARYCGLHVGCDRSQGEGKTLRERHMWAGIPKTYTEKKERMHLFWSVWTMDCCSILVWRRPSAFESQAVFPLSISHVSGLHCSGSRALHILTCVCRS